MVVSDESWVFLIYNVINYKIICKRIIDLGLYSILCNEFN